MSGGCAASTVIVAEQKFVFPAASVTMILTTCGPAPTTVFGGGVWVSVALVQLSDQVISPRRSGMSASQFALAIKWRLVAQTLIVGASLSRTRTRKVAQLSALLPGELVLP